MTRSEEEISIDQKSFMDNNAVKRQHLPTLLSIKAIHKSPIRKNFSLEIEKFILSQEYNSTAPKRSRKRTADLFKSLQINVTAL